jgi:hypothetical protein
VKRRASFSLGEYLFLCFAMFAMGVFVGVAFMWEHLR